MPPEQPKARAAAPPRDRRRSPPPASEEYAYVARDVRRIALIGGSLIAFLVGAVGVHPGDRRQDLGLVVSSGIRSGHGYVPFLRRWHLHGPSRTPSSCGVQTRHCFGENLNGR